MIGMVATRRFNRGNERIRIGDAFNAADEHEARAREQLGQAVRSGLLIPEKEQNAGNVVGDGGGNGAAPPSFASPPDQASQARTLHVFDGGAKADKPHKDKMQPKPRNKSEPPPAKKAKKRRDA